VLAALKNVIKRSPFAPLAASLYGAALPAARRRAMLRNLRYDRETVEVMRRVLRPDSTCVDVGAHEGEILKQMMRFAPRGRHIAFEPIPGLAARLRERFPGTAIHEAACSDSAGFTDFVLVENAPAYSGLRKREYDHANVVLKTLRVQVVRLDDVVDRPVDLIKLDVEGGEYHALRGAVRILANHRPLVIFEAGARSTGQYGVRPQDFTSFFAGLGYRLSTMQRWLAGERSLAGEEFAASWRRADDYYFVALPSAPC
jgi:FkbM family methyltransferase